MCLRTEAVTAPRRHPRSASFLVDPSERTRDGLAQSAHSGANRLLIGGSSDMRFLQIVLDRLIGRVEVSGLGHAHEIIACGERQLGCRLDD